MHKPIKVTRRHRGSGGSIGPLPSTFETNVTIDLILSTYSELRLYFQIKERTKCLIDFHGNLSYINDVTSGRLLGFLNLKFN